MSFSLLRSIVIYAMFCCLVGCGRGSGGTVIHGSVKLDGQPLPGAQVRLVPKRDTNLTAHATVTDQSGNFTFPGMASVARPVQEGTYVVLVSKLASDGGRSAGMGMKNIVPVIYDDLNRSPLQAEIVMGENKLPSYDLVSLRKR